MRRSTWPQPLHAGPPTPASLSGPLPCPLPSSPSGATWAHHTKLSIESRGGATGGVRLNRRSATFGCSADNRQKTQTTPAAAPATRPCQRGDATKITVTRSPDNQHALSPAATSASKLSRYSPVAGRVGVAAQLGGARSAEECYWGRKYQQRALFVVGSLAR
jgi:hypothetical protein